MFAFLQLFMALMTSFQVITATPGPNSPMVPDTWIVAQFGWFYFYDLGSQKFRELPLPNNWSLYQEPWTPDGCHVVFQTRGHIGSPFYYLFSPINYTFEELKVAAGADLFWSPDGQVMALTKTVYADDGTVMQSQLFYVDTAEGAMPELVASYSSSVIVDETWISNDQFAYVVARYPSTSDEFARQRHIWNRQTGSIEKVEQFPMETLIEEILADTPLSKYYTFSAKHGVLIGYYDVYKLGAELHSDSNPDMGILWSSIAEAREAGLETGFDLYTGMDNTPIHINIEDWYVRDLAWSPTGGQLLIEPHMTGEEVSPEMRRYFIYNVDTETVTTVGQEKGWQFGGLRTSTTWSPDEQWLTIELYDGLMLYHLATDTMIPLPEEFRGLSLEWSPVMDYSKITCG